MKKIKYKMLIYLRSLDIKTIALWTTSLLAVNAVTAFFTVSYLEELNNTTTESLVNDGSSDIGVIGEDIIGNENFIDVGFISNSNEQLESYYAITSEGYLYTWGWNIHGELGLGTTDAYVPYPTFVNIDGSFDDKNANGIQDINEFDTITEGDKVQQVNHVNKVWTMSNEINTASVFAISQEGYLYMWGDSNLLPEKNTSEYKYSNTKDSKSMDYYLSPVFVNLDKSYLEEPGGAYVEQPARDMDGLLYRDGSNNIVNVKTPTKTEGDKVKDVDIQAYTYTNYSGVILSESGKLYGWGKNVSKTLDWDKSKNDTINSLSEINYGSSVTEDVKYVEASIHTYGSQSTITALGKDGYLYMWGSATLIPTKSGDTQRTKIDLSDSNMSLDTSHSSKIVSYAYSPHFSSIQLITEDGYLYTLGDSAHDYYSGRGCDNTTEAENLRFYRQDINCNNIPDDDKVKASGITDHTSYFITDDDYLYMYGRGVSGQTGQVNAENLSVPTFVNIDGSFNDINGDGIQQSGSYENNTKTEGDKVVLADNSNANHTLAIDKKGDLYMWGSDHDTSGALPDTTDYAFIQGSNKTPQKVNLEGYEDGEKYIDASYWNNGGITSTNYLNIYYYGGFVPGDDMSDYDEIRKVHKLSLSDFQTPAIYLG
ncbi:MAG: hypothetical protein HRS57_01910 [Mycoplasmataceae bacterium]|nr:hypothetical protein [Mycoplasmataceae bacterium]